MKRIPLPECTAITNGPRRRFLPAFVCMMLLNVPLSAQRQVIFPAGTVTVRQAIGELEKQIGKIFGYSSDLDVSRTVRFEEKVVTADEAIRQVIGEAFTYVENDEYVLIFLKSLEDRSEPLPIPRPSLVGRVVDARTGAPLAETFIEILDRDPSRKRTDRNGMFRFDNLEEGIHIVRVASADGETVMYREVPVRRTPGNRRVEFSLGRPAAMSADSAAQPAEKYLMVRPAEDNHLIFRKKNRPSIDRDSSYLYYASLPVPDLPEGMNEGEQTDHSLVILDTTARMDNRWVEIGFTARIEGVKMKTDRQLTIYLQLSGDGWRMVLPGLRYSGKRRYRQNLQGPVDSLVYEYRGERRERDYEIDFRVALDRAEWMEHATLSYRIVESDRKGDRTGAEQVIIADLNPVAAGAGKWLPAPQVYEKMAYFIAPPVEPVKRRRSVTVLHFEYLGRTAVQAPAETNEAEYKKLRASLDPLLNSTFIQRVISPLLNGPLITVDSIGITSFSSPDENDRSDGTLQQQRAASLAGELKKQYRLDRVPVRTGGMPENWQTLSGHLAQWELPDKKDVLSVIDDPELDPGAKERILKRIGGGEAWRQIQQQVFPALRRTEVVVDYIVRGFGNRQLRELLFTRPEWLSLEEMYRQALELGKESPRYIEAFEQAAEYFPQEGLVWNNLAAVLLQQGRSAEALACLERTPESPEAYMNLGTWYYLMGDLEKARYCFVSARDAGIEQAEENLRLLMEE